MRTKNPGDYEFIQALVDDNTALPWKRSPTMSRSSTRCPEKLREAWRFGRWDVFEGQVFAEFVDDPEHYRDRVQTHVIEPFKIPDSWKYTEALTGDMRNRFLLAGMR